MPLYRVYISGYVDVEGGDSDDAAQQAVDESIGFDQVTSVEVEDLPEE